MAVMAEEDGDYEDYVDNHKLKSAAAAMTICDEDKGGRDNASISRRSGPGLS